MDKRALLLDFDGVIIESREVRDAAFRHIFRDQPAGLVDKLIAYHHANGGISRYEKIRWFYRELLDMNCPQGCVERLAAEFNAYAEPRLITPKVLIEPTVAFLGGPARALAKHIVSGADQREVAAICRAQGIEHLFAAIRGSPTPKADLVGEELSRWDYDPADVVMIGDAINDFEAAAAHNIEFYGYNNPSLRNVGSGYISDWSKFPFGTFSSSASP